MTPRERDAAIAEFFGWRWVKWPTWNVSGEWGGKQIRTDYRRLYHPDDAAEYEPVDGTEQTYAWYFSDVGGGGFPHYSTDLNAMAEAEKEMDERGLGCKYAHELTILCCTEAAKTPESGMPVWAEYGQWSLTDIEVLQIATATATQRAEALVRVIEATK